MTTPEAFTPAMSHQGTDTEALVARLSHQPQTLLRSVITISDPPRPPASPKPRAQDPPPPPNLGALDRLPAELLHEVLLRLDPQSLSRLSRTCRGASALLLLLPDAFPAYARLLAHAGEALAALAGTGLIRVHPVSHLDAALRSWRCGTCDGGGYGAFLFLPACERCCWQCLQYSRDRLVVPPGVACKALGLAPDEVALGGGVPLMRSIPGRYGIRQLHADRPVALVAVAHALELAASRHGGSEAELRGDLLRRGIAGAGAHSVRLLRRLLWDDGYLEGAVLVPDQGSSLVGRYFGMAAVLLPSLSGGAGPEERVEHGCWCRGCEWVYDRRRRLPADVVDRVVRDDPDPDRVMLRMARTAYSTAGFLEHIQHCYGAQELMREPAG